MLLASKGVMLLAVVVNATIPLTMHVNAFAGRQTRLFGNRTDMSAAVKRGIQLRSNHSWRGLVTGLLAS
jgi:hypothetical protein